MKKATHVLRELWSKGVERNLSGEERLEDKINSNLNELKEVDLGFPFVFADKDLMVDGRDMFSYEKYKKEIESHVKNGWRLPTYDELKAALKSEWLSVSVDYDHPYRIFNIKSSKTKNVLTIESANEIYASYYMMEYSEKNEHLKNRHMTPVWVIGDDNKNNDVINNFASYRPNFGVFVRLVKNKKPINELWSKGVERNMSGGERLEDKINSNLNELKEVDLGLPFSIADKDLVIEDKQYFSYPDMKTYEKHVLSSGWRYPTYEELNEHINSNFLEYKDISNHIFGIYSQKTNQTLEVKMDNWFGHDYWCIGKTPTKWKINNGYHKKSSLFFEGESEKCAFNVRLVKDKPVNELWSKGVERNMSGEERLEDKIVSNIDSLNGIDLGVDFLMSDEYLSIDGKDRLTLDEYKQYEEFIHSKGWRLPVLDDITALGFSNRDISFDKTREGNYTEIIRISSSKTGENVEFEFPDTQYMWYEKNPKHQSEMERNLKFGGVWTCIDKEVKIKNAFTNNKYMVRLVKDKPVNELWSKGVERNLTGESRLGERKGYEIFIQDIKDALKNESDFNTCECEVNTKFDITHDLFTFIFRFNKHPEEVKVMIQVYKKLSDNPESITQSIINKLRLKMYELPSVGHMFEIMIKYLKDKYPSVK